MGSCQDVFLAATLYEKVTSMPFLNNHTLIIFNSIKILFLYLKKENNVRQNSKIRTKGK